MKKWKKKETTAQRLNYLFLFLFYLLSFFSFPLSAHILKNSSSEMTVEKQKIHWILKVHLTDFNLKFEQVEDQIVKDYLSNRLIIDLGNQPCKIDSIRMKKDLLKEVVTFDLNYQCLSSTAPLQISYGLFYGDPDHKHLLKLEWNGKVQSYTFSQSNTEAIFTLASSWNTIGSFLKLGFEHILLGFDHVLFVLCLILGARGFKSLFWLATSFTLAHSISLALSVLDIVQLSPRIVEPAIAASIIFLAVWDLWNNVIPAKAGISQVQLNQVDPRLHGDDKLNKILLLTFFFGLIHGLGFSSILKEANLERANIVLPLVSFNLGVEGGQILIIGIIFPLLSFLKGKFQMVYPYLKKICLVGVILISLYWMIERIFF